jgi:hypothetical protein
MLLRHWLREVDISLPNFASYAEWFAYRQARQNPQVYIDRFVANLKGVRPSVAPEYDAFLERAGVCGSATISSTIAMRVDRIRIGTAYLRDSELFKTIFHEEMHIRVRNYALQGRQHHLRLATDPLNDILEEEYVEDVAIRYYNMYIRRYGAFAH